MEMEQLKIKQRELAIRTAHSRKSLADILSNPFALDLLSLDNKEWILELFVGISWNGWWSDGIPLKICLHTAINRADSVS